MPFGIGLSPREKVERREAKRRIQALKLNKQKKILAQSKRVNTLQKEALRERTDVLREKGQYQRAKTALRKAKAKNSMLRRLGVVPEIEIKKKKQGKELKARKRIQLF